MPMPGDEADQRAGGERAPQAQHPHRTDGRSEDETEREALEEQLAPHPCSGTKRGCERTRSSQELIAGYFFRSKPPSAALCV